MQRVCDICEERAATLFESVVESGACVEYAYCEECYTNALKRGVSPHEDAAYRISRRGLECKSCGSSIESFKERFLFGCADCYLNMRDVAIRSAIEAQGINGALIKARAPMASVESVMDLKGSGNAERLDDGQLLKSAHLCTINELCAGNVVSSRIRLARNIRGLEFPRDIKVTDERVVALMNGAYRAANGVFNARLIPMNKLEKVQRKALIERHVISLALANNDTNGAVVLEGDSKLGISVMINEEDHIREQCLESGFNLKRAYERLRAYDVNLVRELPVAFDEDLGFLTACPTNLGTGMRASVMMFLPALKRAGAIGDALKTFKNEYGLTVRGVYGEGSESAYDMYQISNTRTLVVTEGEIISELEQAVVKMCYCERVALEKLLKEKQTELLDGISRSYAVLKGAYTLTAQELMRLLVDVKMGVILGILPIKSTRVLDDLIWSCTSSSLEIITNGSTDEERDKARARIVRSVLAEEK